MSYNDSNVETAQKKPSKLMKIGFIREFVKNKELFLMILPPAIFIFINNYIPMVGLVMAFQGYNYEDRFKSPFVGFKNFDFVIEAIIEDEKTKKETYKELEKIINENTIIATNTSSISIGVGSRL